jgi:gentisate 1,2-dioxygenase
VTIDEDPWCPPSPQIPLAASASRANNLLMSTFSATRPIASSAPPPATERNAFYRRIAPLGLTPLWEVLDALVPRVPATPCVPAHWRWSDVWPHLQEAGQLISAEEAVRRVLILENPALRGQSCITQVLYAGLQLILPGETAPVHRHTQSALRFIVHGRGAFTAVNGQRVDMAPGDFIITPNWTWHDHGNPGAEPVVWLDGLDIPLIRFLDAGFAENGGPADASGTLPLVADVVGTARDLRPLDELAPHAVTNPVFSYPYATARSALLARAASTAPDAWDGIKLAYANPVNGGPAIATLGTCLQWLPRRTSTRALRSTAGTVVSVVEGRGTAVVGRAGGEDIRFVLGPRDHFVVPPWTALRYETDEDMILFSFSDAPVQRALGVLREERL